MPINSNIALGFQPTQLDVGGSLQKGMSLREMKAQAETRDRNEQERMTMNDVMKRHTKVGADGRTQIDRGAALSELNGKVDQSKVMAFQKQLDDMDSESLQRVTQQAKQIAWSVTPENYGQKRQEAIQLGLPNADKLPEYYSPQFVERWQIGTLDGEKQLAYRQSQEANNLKRAEIVASKASKAAESASKLATDKVDRASKLRTERSGLATTKATADTSAAYNKIQSAAKNPSAAGDMSLIFGYMKMLDPGSTVREGEFANAQNAGGIDDKTMNVYNQILNGQRLSPEQRRDFMNQAEGVYSSQMKVQRQIDKQYENLAMKAGLDPKDVILNFAADGDLDSMSDEELTALYNASQTKGKTAGGGTSSW